MENTMKVISNTLGTGTVISQDEQNVTVDFNGIVKTLIIRFAHLTNEDGTPFGEQFVPKKSRSKKLNPVNFGKLNVRKMSRNEYDEWNERRINESLPSSLR